MDEVVKKLLFESYECLDQLDREMASFEKSSQATERMQASSTNSTMTGAIDAQLSPTATELQEVVDAAPA